MNAERLQELAALNAAGALDGKDLEELHQLLKDTAPAVKAELAAFNNIAALLAAALPEAQRPSPSLKAKILQRVNQSLEQPAQPEPQKILSPAPGGFHVERGIETSGWRQLRLPGASVKLLSLDEADGYAVGLGKLEPGTRYPAHRHACAEEVYVLSGDLHIGEHLLHAGDFHHAGAGTAHGENYSETGCTILAVISAQDLMAQFAAT